MWISTVAMVISKVAYAIQDEGNHSSSAANCASDELPASIN
jgi:hypothetical protein